MKKNIHPKTRPVVFFDMSADAKFLINSSIKTDKTIQHEGVDLPLVTIDISSKSHPFYTGKNLRSTQVEGRVARFTNRYAKTSK